jgi:hypothetical protein
MSAIALKPEYFVGVRRVLNTTLLDLVHRVSRVVDDEETVAATVLELLESGRAHLTGSFRDVPIEMLPIGETRHRPD